VPLDDVTMTALTSALRGLSLRQRITADNIANINTPGYQAGRVDFESALRAALNDGVTPEVAGTVGESAAPSREDGNNVNLDDESVSMIDTGLRYQLVVDAVNTKFQLLRDAIKGGGL